MLLIELAMQGIRGLPALVRLPLQPGLNVLVAPDAAQRRALIDAVFHTLHSGASGPDVLAALCAQPPCRASATLKARDGKTYRVVRELTGGSARLLRYAHPAEKFETLSEDPSEVAQYLRVQLQFPGETPYERLFVLSPESMAHRGRQARSRRGTELFGASASGPLGGASVSGASVSGGSAALLGMARPLSPAFAFDDHASPMGPLNAPAGFGPDSGRSAPAFNPSNALVRAELDGGSEAVAESRSADLEAKRREHARLQGLLVAIRESRHTREELEVLLRRREVLKPRAEERRLLEQQLHDLAAQLEQHGDLVELPPNLDERIRDLHQSEERYAAEQKRIAEERTEAERSKEDAVPPRLWTDRYFQAGAGVMVVSYALALALDRAGLALLNLPGALVAAAAALHHIELTEKSSRLGVRLAMIAEREAKVQKQYELETGVAKKLLKQLEIDDPAELLERLSHVQRLKGALLDSRQRLAALDVDPASRAELEELDRVEVRIEELEAHLMSLEGDGSSGNTGDLVRRVDLLGRELRALGVDPSAPVPKAERHSEPPLLLEYEEEEEDGYGSGYGGPPAAARPTGKPGKIGLFASAGWEGGALGGAPPGAYGGGGGGPSGPEPTRVLLEAAAELLHQPADAVGAAIEGRLAQYLAALTDGVFTRGHVGARGELRLSGPDGAELGLLEVPSERALAVEAAIRLTLLELVTRKVPAPVLLDDPFTSFEERQRKVVSKSLRYLAQVTQVLLVTPSEDVTEGHRVRW